HFFFFHHGHGAQLFIQPNKWAGPQQKQRFLIVLDDIWREDVWNQMQRSFPDVNNGSRVLITTQFLNVAKGANPRSTPYELPLLNDNESMKLLLKKAFPYEDTEANCSSGLLDISHQLMRKCGGLPLALVVLGGLLSIKDKTPVVWRRVLETMDWAAEGRECQEILALSYEDLPYHMKSCFLYLGAYHHWQCVNQAMDCGRLHTTGRKEDHGGYRGSYFRGVDSEELDSCKNQEKQWECQEMWCLCSSENDQQTYLASRRVAFHNVNDTTINEISRVSTMHGQRNLMAFGLRYPPIDSPIFRFELLRVLDLTELTSVRRLPKEIGLMIHLRYLRLRDVDDLLPLSVGNFQSLETVLLTQIKKHFWAFKSSSKQALRHVQVKWCKPPQSLELKNLLTLEYVALGSYKTINWRFPNLRKLKVEINKEHQGTMLTHLLCELDHLISLFIDATGDFPIEINTKDFPFHNHLLSLTLYGFWPKGDTISEFPTCLTKLELSHSRLEQDPMPKLERLQYLVTLKLFQNVYLGKTMVCSTGRFPSLKSLFIAVLSASEDPMPNLEEWRVERGAMAKLAFLTLISCKKLKVFPDLQHVMSLQELEFRHMSQELMFRLQRKAGEDWYKIQHVPKLTFEEW
ncbi:probable disease resistance protein At1g58602, partial [Dioscorea cayenensis subsp. rotundata]|uniref:Probable disease resistance protein At1g58602 n=1 Tax=Dioscorea cayennensis subsp. rotundata TaxID=55577 RepID=A0AB40AW65_DIOCR